MSAETERRADLDNLKVVLVAAVIVAHAAMTYGVIGSWVYEEPGLSRPMLFALNACLVFGALFGLGLFYLVAGWLTPGPLDRRGPADFLANRFVRLGLPLIAYVLIVWPILRWLADRAAGDHSSLVAFYRDAFSWNQLWSLGSGPLWFVAVLLALTTGWVGWRWARPVRGSLVTPLSPLAPIAAAIGIAAATFLVRLAFPVDSPQFLDLHLWLWPQAAAMFVLGAVGYEHRWSGALSTPMRIGCTCAAGGGVVALGLMIWIADAPDAFAGGWRWEALGLAAVEGVFAVAASLLVLDRFRRRHNRPTRWGRRLARGSYPAFVAQGPILVAIALALRSIPAPADLKFLVLAVAGVVGSFLIGLAVQRRAE